MISSLHTSAVRVPVKVSDSKSNHDFTPSVSFSNIELAVCDTTFFRHQRTRPELVSEPNIDSSVQSTHLPQMPDPADVFS
ncbi:hypothetical protein AVEN_18884-1 [Araneus ventricosus]|uniref:Uncharacterized protein n=1 Tax=Araneus ventricosus TaxID=182803 RepID=A0A4Y2UAF3_ARAVE|nr:hypothetical protein AVEN_18884-1 [Araneus ventricosus]